MDRATDFDADTEVTANAFMFIEELLLLIPHGF
jgi:hypothetical protein